jgi:hypothetical protein
MKWSEPNLIGLGASANGTGLTCKQGSGGYDVCYTGPSANDGCATGDNAVVVGCINGTSADAQVCVGGSGANACASGPSAIEYSESI